MALAEPITKYFLLSSLWSYGRRNERKGAVVLPIAEQEWRPKAVVTEEPPKRDDTAAKPFGMSDASLP
jgi:hypothetical protein